MNFFTEKSCSGQFYIKEIDFCINWLLNEYNFEIYNLIYTNLNQNFNPIYLTKIIDKIINHFEITHKDNLHSFLGSEIFKRLFDILRLITIDFSLMPDIIKIKNLKDVLNFLSFVQYEISTKQDSSNTKFLNYFVEIIKQNYDMELDELFAIRHKLYGHENFLKDLIQNLSLNKSKNISLNDLETMKLALDELTDVNSTYLVLKIVDHHSNSVYGLELKEIFWSLFNRFNIDQKISLIFMIYQLKEITIINFSVGCCQDKNFENYLTVCMNQVSATSDQDEEVSLVENQIF